MKRLNSALDQVRSELHYLEIWTPALAAIEIYLVPIGHSYGWKHNGRSGHISIPAVSLNRLAHRMFGIGRFIGLREILRHEYAHALADCHRRELIKDGDFTRTFGGAYDNTSMPYSMQPSERFANCVADYIRQRGICDDRQDDVLDEWFFVWEFVQRIRKRSRP